MCHQLSSLARLMVFVEIAVYPAVQILRFAYIYNLPVFVEILIHARTLGYAMQ